MVQTDGYQKVIPSATSAQAAADEYSKYYSADDQATYGALAVQVTPTHGERQPIIDVLSKR